MMRANEESETKSKRLKATWQQKRKSLTTKKLTSVCPAWLRLNENTGQFEALSNHAIDSIKTIFDLCIEQEMGAYTITRYLNRHIEKHPAIGKTGLWQTSYVSKILNAPSVYGYFQPRKRVSGKKVDDGDPIEDYFPTIVIKERYLLAQAKSKRRSTCGGGRKGELFPNLFTKFLKCGRCGSTVTSFGKGSADRIYNYLQCRGYRERDNCDCVAWR